MSFALRASIAVLALLVFGCSRSTQETSTSSESHDTSASSPTPPEPPAGFDSTITALGLGPVHAGMTLAEAEAALQTTLTLVPPNEPCAYVFVGERPGIALMVVEGRIARVDIQQGTIRTAEGTGIGDTEGRIRSVYSGRVEVQPHKYIDGHYLIVRPQAPADSGHRIIFETDGKNVLRFRSGRMPEVRWVEGCS